MRKALISYIAGFALSLLLTFIAYISVVYYKDLFNQVFLISSIIVIAFIQLLVQLVFFLHLGTESRPKWNTLIFMSTFVSIMVIVVASIWIMNHLNYNMTPGQIYQYIQNQSGF